jgi:hypothetical protein
MQRTPDTPRAWAIACRLVLYLSEIDAAQLLLAPDAARLRPGAEAPRQLTRITASRPLQIAACVFARPPRQRPCRDGFGPWAPAAQVKRRTLGGRNQACDLAQAKKRKMKRRCLIAGRPSDQER